MYSTTTPELIPTEPPGIVSVGAKDTHRLVAPEAVAAATASLLWLGGIGSIAGIALGFRALGRIKRTGEGGTNWAVMALVLGFAGVIVALLLAIAGARMVSAIDGTFNAPDTSSSSSGTGAEESPYIPIYP